VSSGNVIDLLASTIAVFTAFEAATTNLTPSPERVVDDTTPDPAFDFQELVDFPANVLKLKSGRRPVRLW